MKKKLCSLEEMHDVQLGLLKELKRVCDQNGIRYYLACGTCLGAVRHKGFIPWDHDADVFMYYSDIKKLEAVADQFGEAFFLQHKKSDPNFDSIIYRLCNSNTTWLSKNSIGFDTNHGFALDIYPLYFYPDNKLAGHFNILISYFYRILVAGVPPKNHGKGFRLLARMILCFFGGKRREAMIRCLNKQLTKYKHTQNVLTYFGLDISPWKALLYKSAWFREPQVLPFEDTSFTCPTDADAYLKCKYGDYMKLPSIEKRKAELESIMIADVRHSYQQYRKYYLRGEKKQ